MTTRHSGVLILFSSRRFSPLMLSRSPSAGSGGGRTSRADGDGLVYGQQDAARSAKSLPTPRRLMAGRICCCARDHHVVVGCVGVEERAVSLLRALSEVMLHGVGPVRQQRGTRRSRPARIHTGGRAASRTAVTISASAPRQHSAPARAAAVGVTRDQLGTNPTSDARPGRRPAR